MNATWKQRLSNWACGAVTGAAGLVVGGPLLTLYASLSALVMPLPSSFATAAAAFLAIDLLYYWLHRLEHSVPVLWAIHEVHHQSKLCDTSVSFRTSVLAPLAVLTPHLVLALLGVPVATYLAAYLLHTSLVFLLHSRTPSWLDRAGAIFNSPFLHRGHHSTHPTLRNKNFGGVFIIWDRLCGTFEPRCEVATEFGLAGRLAPLSPLEANVAPLRRLLAR